MTWSDTDSTQLRTLWLGGTSLQIIAEKLDRPPSTVMHHVNRLDLPLRGSTPNPLKGMRGHKWTPELIETLRRMWDEGAEASKIAAEIKMSRNAVKGKAFRLGLAWRPSPIKRAPRPTETAKRLAELHDQHCRFPLGEEKAPAEWFCGDEAAPGKPYCTNHCNRAFVRWFPSTEAA